MMNYLSWNYFAQKATDAEIPHFFQLDQFKNHAFAVLEYDRILTIAFEVRFDLVFFATLKTGVCDLNADSVDLLFPKQIKRETTS